MRIFLTGFMGCGKSFWGQQLAKELEYPFYDLDSYIEENEMCSINEIFAIKGEDEFRKLEHNYLSDLIHKKEKYVLATGGGTPCFYNNMKLMNENGSTCYLNASEDLLYSRLNREQSHRPLIQSLYKEELKLFIHELLKEREAFYLQSEHILDVNWSDRTIFERLISLYV